MNYKKCSKNIISIFTILIIVSSSCVSSKKYDAALGDLARMKVDSSVVANELATIKYNTSKDLNTAQNKIISKTAKLDSLQSVLKYQENELNGLTSTLKDAFPALTDVDFSTFIENGYVHLALDHRVLFYRGENALSSHGKEIIQAVSDVIKNIDSDIMVLGHTDSLPYYSTEKDNWELSINRAHSVVEVLIENGVSPDKIILAGRSKHDPEIDNSTQVGRMLNRRIELILMPDMRKVEDLFAEYVVN